MDLVIQILAQVVEVKLCDLVDGNGDWKWQVFQGWVPHETQHRITACNLSDSEYENDKFITYDTCTCEFSIKDIFNILCNMENGRGETA